VKHEPDDRKRWYTLILTNGLTKRHVSTIWNGILMEMAHFILERRYAPQSWYKVLLYRLVNPFFKIRVLSSYETGS